MRILMALPDKRVRGGPPSHLYLLRDSLLRLGLDVRSFVYGGRTHDEGRLRKVVHRLLDLARFPLHIVRHRPDVVHLNSAFDKRGVLRDVFFVPLARLLGQTVVIKFHGSDLELVADKNLVWRLLTWITVRSASTVCLLSHEEREAFAARFPKGRFAVVKNALDLTRYRPGGGFRSRYDIPGDKVLLLFIARFIGTKGLVETIRALPAIRQRHNAHVVFVGDGPSRGEGEELCKQLNVQEHTTFTGYVPEEETIDAYAAADLLVFPTYHCEGMPMVIFHSLASGLPIITTRIRAAADWLREGEHCLFVPPRDPASVASAVIALLDDPARHAQMRQSGRELAGKFERAAVAGEFRDLYLSLTFTNGRMETQAS